MGPPKWWVAFVFGGVLGIVVMAVTSSFHTVGVAEWREVSVLHRSAPFKVPAKVEHAGVEYECVLVGTKPTTVLLGEVDDRSLKWNGEWWVPGMPLPEVPVRCDHEWSRLLDGESISGAECVSCGEVSP